mmetsp:Transcript_47100/g.84844  ORF Transcript_47100/g.84844 Transcript_47100/m.84844 type:complete len:82 (+) Transcript_47100:46-291(+)
MSCMKLLWFLLLAFTPGAWGIIDPTLDPACWINWQTITIDENGQEEEGVASGDGGVVMLINVIFFYVIFWFVIKALVLQTQ